MEQDQAEKLRKQVLEAIDNASEVLRNGEVETKANTDVKTSIISESTANKLKNVLSNYTFDDTTADFIYNNYTDGDISQYVANSSIIYNVGIGYSDTFESIISQDEMLGSIVDKLGKDFAKEVYEKGQKASGNNKNGTDNSTVSNDDVKYSIQVTTDDKPVVVIENDFLKDVDKENWAKRTKDELKRFKNGINIWNAVVKVNAISRREFTNSKYSKYLKNIDSDLYRDKLLTSSELDDILKSTKSTRSEYPKHNRNDNIKQFARSEVLIRVGNSDYIADIIIGVTKNDEFIFYDMVNFRKTFFKIKNVDVQAGYANNAGTLRNRTSTSANNISQNENAVKSDNKFSLSVM